MTKRHKSLIDDLTPVAHGGDGRGDYLDRSLEHTADVDAASRGRRLSSEWALRRTRKTKPDEVVFDMMRIRNVVENLLKIHGIPDGTDISIATLGQGARGAASFRGLPAFTGPYILLDKTIYEQADPEDVMDVYLGAALHEAGHLNGTRQMFRRLHAGELKGERRMWEGLLEDERIEAAEKKRSPGYAGYLHATKRAFFEKKEFGFALANWAELPDLDKVAVVAVAFIRCPYTLTEEHKTWMTVTGACPYEELHKTLDRVPETEWDVEDLGGKLMACLDALRKPYRDMKDAASGDAGDFAEELAKARGIDPEELKKAMEDAGAGEGEAGEGELGDAAPSGDSGATGDDDVEPGDGGAGGAGDGVAEPGDSDGGEDEGLGEGEGSGAGAGSGAGDDGTEAEGGSPTGSDADPTSSLTSKGTPGGGTGSKAPTREEIEEAMERIAKQGRADDRDARDAAKARAVEKAAAPWERSLDGLDSVERISERAREDEKTMRAAKRTLDKVEAARDKVEAIMVDRKGRFSIIDLSRMVERLESCGSPLDVAESVELAKATEDRLEFGEEWEAGMIRRTVIAHPKPTGGARKRFDAAMAEVKGYVARTKALFAFRLGKRQYTQRERAEGRLDRTRLARAQNSDRIFKTSYTREDKGLAVCLLLDESGSMGWVWVNRDGKISGSAASKALQIAAMFASALKGVPGVELEVYSYGSCGPDERDCLVKYLYGKQNPELASVGGYEGSFQNYDHIAIRTAGDLFVQNTRNDNRLMIVLSDGAPAGHCYGGAGARRATRDEVQRNKKRGIQTVQVAIQNFRSEDMFEHVVRFTDFATLIAKMRGLLTKVVKRFTNT
jgi:hypothetical protein